MNVIVKRLTALALLMLSTSAFAFHLEVRSDNPDVTESQLRAMTKEAGNAIGNRIPENTREVYVYVLTRAKPRENDASKLLYFHRVELRRHVHADKAPYAFNGWLSIKSEEYYGVDDKDGMKRALEKT